MKERDKSLVESLISPVFHEAAMMIEKGALSSLVGHRDVRNVDGSMVWARFLAKLQSESSKKWPRKLPVQRFTQFISALAEARWCEIHFPKKDGRKHGLLVEHISKFLAAAEGACFPWAKGGDVFYDSDEGEEDHDYDLEGDYGVDIDDYDMDQEE